MSQNKIKYNPADYSIGNILNFLTMVGEEDIIGHATARSRRGSISSVLVNGEVLTESERLDARQIDVADVVRRVRAHYTKNYSHNSMQTHCSHVRCAIRDFIDYNNDPSRYPSGCYIISPGRAFRQSNSASSAPYRHPASPSLNQPRSDDSTFSIPIPIKGGKQIVMVDGLPNDFSKEDADKISAVILALATGQSASA